MKIRLFNAKYSPNLGDGLLSECLENALQETNDKFLQVTSIDAAGRTEYDAGSTSRGTLLKYLHQLPDWLRRTVLWLPLRMKMNKSWQPHYSRSLHDADALVIGGGNLFTDMDLNFPTKIAGVIKSAKARNMPISIYGVGVSDEWSDAGLRLMENAFRGASVEYVSVRDAASKQNFDRLFSRMVGRNADIVRDPGLLISRYVPSEGAQTEVVGINVMSAVAVRYHSATNIGDDALLDWYSSFCNALANAGLKISLFSNASPEDVQFAKRLAPLLRRQSSPIDLYRPKDPSELARFVAGCALVVAFRMHALIAAHSYGIPVIALKWDKKVEWFMESIGNKNLIDVSNARPETVATMVINSIGSIDERRDNSATVEEAFKHVNALATSLSRRDVS